MIFTESRSEAPNEIRTDYAELQKEFTGSPFEPWGYPEDQDKYDMFNPEPEGDTPMELTPELVREGGEMMCSMYKGGIYDEYESRVVSRKVAIGGPQYHTDASRVYAIVTVPKGEAEKKNRRCMIHYHGGGAVGGSPEASQSQNNRFAVDADVNVVSVSYRLAPENKAPKGIIDAYAALKEVIENPDLFGCDPTRIGIFGESGGGYITAGVGMLLAERNEADLIRFQIQMTGMVGNMYALPECERPPMNQLTRAENNNFIHKAVLWMQNQLSESEMDPVTNTWVCPNLMRDNFASRVPPVVVMTSEFDELRYMNREAADLYRRNGNLIALLEFGGSWHCSYFDFELPQSSEYFKAFVKLTEALLL